MGTDAVTELPEDAIKTLGSQVATIEVRIGPQFLNLFSKQLYSSPNKAFEELISNSWDADAHNVYVHIPDDLTLPTSSIWILDDGVSMDVEGLRDLWSVAASKKREATKATKRKPIGKFGVGKLATYLLANELTYACKSADDVIRLVTMDYRDIDSKDANKLHIEPVPLRVREVTLPELTDFLAGISGGELASQLVSSDVPEIATDAFEDEFGGEGTAPSAKSGTWTLAILSSLKVEGSQIQTGWIKQLLRTALPLGNSIKIKVNDEVVRPKKSDVEVKRDWVIGPGLDIKSIQLGDSGPVYEIVEHNTPQPRVEIVGIGSVSGKVKLFAGPISGGKSERKEVSNGFFVNVLGRTIKPDDPYFGLDNLQHSVWAKFRATVRADFLDGKLTVDREGVSDSPEVQVLRAFLMKLFNKARVAAVAAIESGWPTSGDTIVGDFRERLPFQPLERIVGERLGQPGRNPEFLDDSSVTNPTELKKSWVDEIVGDPRKLVRETIIEELPPTEKLVRYDVGRQKIVINKSHPFAVEYAAEPETLRMLQDSALVDILTDAYILDSGVSEERLDEIRDYRDRMHRLVANLRRQSAPQIAKLLAETTDHIKGFEVIVGDALEYLGFVVERMGESGKPEGVASAIVSRRGEDRNSENYKLTYDAKSSQKGKASAGNVGVSGLARHKADYGAQYSLVVAPAFASGALEKECEANGVTPMSAASLAELVMLTVGHGPLDLLELKTLFECHSPAATANWITNLANSLKTKKVLSISVIMGALKGIVSENPKLPDVIHAAQIAERCRALLGDNEFPTRSQVRQALGGLQLIAPNVLSINESGDVFLLTAPDQIASAVRMQLAQIPKQLQFGLVKSE